MEAFLQTTLSNAFSGMKHLYFYSNFTDVHWASNRIDSKQAFVQIMFCRVLGTKPSTKQKRRFIPLMDMRPFISAS